MSLFLSGTASPGLALPSPGEVSGDPDTLCPFYYAADPKATTGVPLGRDACKAAREFDAIFRALREVADIQEDELRLWRVVSDKDDYNAFYSPSLQAIRFTKGFLACHRAMPQSAAVVIGHEIGHALQDKYGQSFDGKASYRRRQEGQADEVGRELVRDAHFGVPLEGSWEQTMSCLGNPGSYYATHSHPSSVVRWNAAASAERTKTELERARERLAEMSRGSGFEEWRQFGAVMMDVPDLDAERASRIAGTRPGYRIAPGDFKLTNSLGSYSDQGLPPSHVSDVKRMREAGIPDPYTVPTELTRRAVALSGAAHWLPPYSPLTPAEMLVYAARFSLGERVTDMPPDEAFRRALDYIVRNEAWELLPGTVLAGGALAAQSKTPGNGAATLPRAASRGSPDAR